MALILGSPKVQISQNGSFLVGGKVYIYDAGTSNPRASYPTWDDAVAQTNANDNPVILDSRGEADIVLSGPSRVVVTDADDVQIYVVDDLDTANVDIIDVQGTGLLTFTSASSAVNHVQVSNAAAGNAVSIDAVGDDTNIGLDIQCKGTETFYIGNGNLQVTLGDITVTSGNVTLNSGGITVTAGTVNIPNGNINIQDGTGGFSFLPAGSMTWFAGSTVPDGWLECDGSAISRSTYARLFTKVGTSFGVGDGSTTFNLPNQARRVLVGKGGVGTGTLGNSIGDTGGSEEHTLTASEMPSHTHGYNGSQVLAIPNLLTTTANSNYTGSLNVGKTSDSVGGDQAHNILQPSLVMMLIMRAY